VTVPRRQRETTAASPLPERALRKLVDWYHRHRREMPWRSTRDPYLVWISEILLQQTQVETVRPYFFRFVRAFPTMEALASAPVDKVLKAWEGCGYYARARNLHRAAQIVVHDYAGQLPRTAQELRKLPGIGPYTAAAIASIVYGEPVLALDGNIERVLARVLCEQRSIKTTAVRKRLAKVGHSLMQEAVRAKITPGDLNQALMDLGALTCTPRRANCLRCALQRNCRAFAALKDVTILPKRKTPVALPHYDIGAAMIRKRGRLLITQRPLEGMLGGLWEFPGGKRQRGETLTDCVAREIREELGIEIEVGQRVARVDHSYSHFRITLHAFDCTQISGRVRKIGVADFRWVKPEELENFAFPKADRVIIEGLMGNPK
jgi:A/G-specific adenine glycosylase